MEYSLYVYGGGQVLWNVFNGIALLFRTENPYFTTVGYLTMLIGIIYAAVQAIPRANFAIFFKSWFLPTFLLTGLFYGPKASVHIIDKADSDFRYVKVDNIPVGLAAVASLSTHLSEYLTENVETIFTNSDAERFSQVGPMFGARLIQAANTLTIKDPLMKENLKDFTRQCFAWPYIFSNLAPGKKAALESEDMLGFIEANPHPLLGIYWREGNGRTSFMNCTACAAKVKQVIGIEVNQGFTSLAQEVFGAHVSPERTTHRLNQYFGDAWGALASGTSESASVIQQELMLNSYREALQDKRDELGLGRSQLEMAHLNAARGIAQQDSSFLVKGLMAGTMVPILHTILFALAMIYFSIIAPMTFLPQGTRLLVHWVKVMIYLSTWPVLFAILNCIGQMYASKAMATKMIGYGEGLNLLTQNGMADIAQSAYMAVMGLQLSVPFLAWTLLWGGGYAFSQMSSSLTQGAESFAAKTGSETVDGNVSFDTQSLHTKTVANTQMAQQQLGANINYGSRFDDGKLATLYGSGGQTTVQEHQTQLGTNVSQNDAFSTMLGMQSAMMQNSAFQQSQQSQRSLQEGMGNLVSVGNTLADNKSWTDTYGNSESAQAQQSFSKAMRMAEDFSKANNIDIGKAVTILTKAGIDAGAGIGTGGLFGSLGASLGAQGTWTTDAKDQEHLSKAKSSNIGRDFTENFSKGIQYVEDHKGSVGLSSQAQMLDQAQKSFNEASSFNEQASATMGYSKQLGQQASEQRQKSISATSNINDSVINQVAERKFGGDKAAAGQWLSRNPQAFQQEASQYLERRQNSIHQGGMISRQGIDQHYQQSKDKAEGISTQKADIEKRIHKESQLFTQKQQVLNNKVAQETLNTSAKIDQQNQNLEKEKAEIEASKREKEKRFEENKQENLTKKAWDKW